MGSHHNVCRQIPKGTEDITGLAMREREYVLGEIKSIYEVFGFNPQHTPILENAMVFSGHHGAGEALLFKLSDKNDEQLVLRYDLTVPLARVVSMYSDLPRPYKRYQIAQVFRDDKEDKGHFREFTQCDADVVGATSLMCDAETIMMAYCGLKKLGFEDFTIRINHRAILMGIAEKIGLDKREAITILCRAIDGADKVTKDGIEGIVKDLKNNSIPTDYLTYLANLIVIDGSINHVMSELQKQISNDLSLHGINELKEIFSYLSDDILEKVKIDISLARGADYYTGFILEGVIHNSGIGAVLGGGRFDNLVSAFSDISEPAVGMAFGLDRIMIAMNDAGFLFRRHNDDRRILAMAYSDCDRRILLRYIQPLRDSGVACNCLPIYEENMEIINDYAVKNGVNEIIICRDGAIEHLKLG